MLGNEFRDYIFENQLEVNPQNLRAYAEKFATAHKFDLPFVIDPGGKLAPNQCGSRSRQSHKLDHTPTVYRQQPQSSPYVEVGQQSTLFHYRRGDEGKEE